MIIIGFIVSYTSDVNPIHKGFKRWKEMENKAQSIVSKHNDFKVMLDLNLGMQESEKTCINK